MLEMAQKRSAKEAFGAPNGQLSAAAAARQAKLLKDQAQQTESSDDLLGSIAGVSYNAHHSGTASDEDEHAGLTANTRKLVVPQITFSTWNPNATSALDDDDANDYIDVFLKADQYVTFIGEYDLKVAKGVVNIQGAMIHPDLGPQRIYAWSTHALPVITARMDSKICIGSVRSGMLKLAKLSPLFRNIGATKSQRSFQFLPSNVSDPLNRPLLLLETDEATKRIISRLNAKVETTPSLRILAVGPKSSGKSTFNRLVCNMLVSRPGVSKNCWYLDLDPGQPEFGPPGQLSLVDVSAPVLGPPYTHPATTSSKAFRLVRCHTIAATTFKDDAEHYLACAADLIAEAASNHQPMVINSCGWTSGLGASTLISLIRALPSLPEIVLLGESPDSELSTFLPAGIPQHVISRRARVQGTRTPAEQRAMATMGYFHQKFAQKKEQPSWNPKPLSVSRPWLLPYNSTADRGLTAIMSYGQAPHPDFLAEALDGLVVAIAVVSSGTIAPSAVQRTTTGGLPYLPESYPSLDPKHSHCLGLALIRGIDVSEQTIQLITPVNLEVDMLEEEELMLVRGGFDSPDWAYLEDLYASSKGDVGQSGDRPWVSSTGESVEHGKVWRVRRPPMAGGKG